MSWKRHMTMDRSKISKQNTNELAGTGSNKNYSSYLPAVYTGMTNRTDRYRQYDQMDQDPEVNTALDILTDFCTQNSDDYEIPFNIKYKDEMGDSEVITLESALDGWCTLNSIKTRIYDVFRSYLKHGDQFFVRDPETHELLWVNPSNVEKITVNESTGKVPIVYFMRDVSLNVKDKVLSNAPQGTDRGLYNGGTPNSLSSASQYSSAGASGGGGSSANPYSTGGQNDVIPVSAEHVVHISLNPGTDPFWPFGTSVLESVFKVYKQKELLEDSIIIYRVQRAPERRVFKIDVGDMPAHQALSYVERMKNEIHQRRIPSSKGGSTSLMDATYNPLCLDMNTRIPLLDGRTLSIYELRDEYKAGKENWVYSCHPTTGDVVPGVVTWAGVTKEKSKVIKLTFDNGETLICTEDHKIPVLGVGFKEAKDLTTNDSLIAFNRKKQSLSTSKSGATYEMVYNHVLHDWQYTHRMVGEYFKEIGKHQVFHYLPENYDNVKNVVHHKDFNRYNNDPRNLQWMNKEDHFLYHSTHSSNIWNSRSPEELSRIKKQISGSLKDYYINLSDDEKIAAKGNIIAAQKKFVELRNNDPEFSAKYNSTMSQVRTNYINENPEFKAMLLDNISDQMKKPWCNIEMRFTREMLGRISNIVKLNNSNRLKTIELCDNDVVLMSMFNEANPVSEKGIDNIDRTKWGYKKLDLIIRQFGFTNWKEFARNVNEYNHKIVSIEYLDDEIEVGTITVDGKERWHNYHTFAIESGIFVKNSMLEDYFFPQTADGRGSSVETLPGGENLGQIDDLRWFNNKLIRGLKIPSSYLPFGPDDGGTLINDGGVGKALIQEHRFNKALMRWQTLFSKTIDQEFKRYISAMGFNLSADSFEITFTPPMNFASYRKAELDQTMINTYAALNDFPYIAKQTILEKMGWTQEEIIKNERYIMQENPKKAKGGGASDDQAGLQSVGISAPNDPDMSTGLTPEDTEGLGTSEGSASPLTGAGLDSNAVGGTF